MYLSPANLRCHVAASENGRFAFRSIALTDKGTVSTDGRLLLFVPYPTVENVPAIKGVDVKPLKDGETLLLDPEDAAKAAGMVPSKPLKPELGVVHVQKGRGQIKLAAGNGNRVQTLAVEPVDGQYPDYRSVIPDYSEAKKITFNVALLLKAIKTINSASESENVTLRLLDDEKAMSISTRDGVALIIMPLDDHCADGFAVKTEETVESAPEEVAAQSPEPQSQIQNATPDTAPVTQAVEKPASKVDDRAEQLFPSKSAAA